MISAGAVRAAATPPDARRTIAALPAWFEPNAGRLPADVRFFSRGGVGTLYVSPTAATFAAGGDSLRLRLPGANPDAAVEGILPTGAQSAWLVGRDRSRWAAGIAHYSKVRARQVYPGIDLVYYLANKELEFDFMVAPGADPGPIRLAFDGAGRPRLDRSGDLVFRNGFRQRRPVAYQETGAGRVPVKASYRLSKNGEVVLALGRYDKSAPLVVDPVLDASFIGGDAGDTPRAAAVDKQGRVYITGSSASTITSQIPGVQDAPKGVTDVFLAQFVPDASGKLSLAYWTALGGSAAEEASAIAVGDDGFVYLAGHTDSTDFMLAGVPLQEAYGGGTDAFVVKIMPSAGTDGLWFSQTYGGNGTDVATSLAVDSAGAVYVGGYTNSDSIPGASSETFQCCNRGGYEGFMIKVVPGAASPLAYGTYFGGGGTDAVTGIAVTPAGEVAVTGYTGATDFALNGERVYQSEMHSSMDAFVSLFDFGKPGLDALLYSTYLGGNALDVPTSMALDASGGLWIGGYTLSTDFPVTPGAYRTVAAGWADGFLLRFDLNLRNTPAAVTYSTYVGGGATDVPYGLALLPGGRVALAGYTYSTDYPVTGDAARGARGGADAFVSVIDPAKAGAAGLEYSALLGGQITDVATGVATDGGGNLYVPGYAYSVDFPVTDGSSKLSPGGLSQGFLVKVTQDAAWTPQTGLVTRGPVSRDRLVGQRQ